MLAHSRWKLCGIITKANNGPNFQYIKFSVIELVFTDRRNISGTCQNWPWVNLLVLDFRSVSREKFHYQRHWICRFRLWTSLSVSGKDFLAFNSHKLKKFWQTTLDWEWWRLCRLFINQTKWRERGLTCQQLIGDIKHTWKDFVFFPACCYGFSEGWNPCLTP